MVDARKTQLSLAIGFLALILLLIVLWLMQAAVAGETVARWVLLIIFGVAAVALASFGIGYILLLFVEPREPSQQKKVLQQGEFTARRTVKHEPVTTWIPLEQLQQTAQKEQRQLASRRRSGKKKRR